MNIRMFVFADLYGERLECDLNSLQTSLSTRLRVAPQRLRTFTSNFNRITQEPARLLLRA